MPEITPAIDIAAPRGGTLRIQGHQNDPEYGGALRIDIRRFLGSTPTKQGVSIPFDDAGSLLDALATTVDLVASFAENLEDVDETEPEPAPKASPRKTRSAKAELKTARQTAKPKPTRKTKPNGNAANGNGKAAQKPSPTNDRLDSLEASIAALTAMLTAGNN